LIDQGLTVSAGKRRRYGGWAAQRGAWISKVIHIDDRLAIGLIEAVAAHVAPVRQERRRLHHIGPLVAGESGIVVVGAAGKTEGIGVSALESLDPGNLPSAENRVQQATPIHEFLAPAERQLVGRIRDETVVAIVTGASFLQCAVLNG